MDEGFCFIRSTSPALLHSAAARVRPDRTRRVPVDVHVIFRDVLRPRRRRPPARFVLRRPASSAPSRRRRRRRPTRQTRRSSTGGGCAAVHVQGGARVERAQQVHPHRVPHGLRVARRVPVRAMVHNETANIWTISCWGSSWSSRSSRSPWPPAGVTRTSPRSRSRGRSARTTRARRCWSRGRTFRESRATHESVGVDERAERFHGEHASAAA